MIRKLRHFGQDRFGNPSRGENFSFDLSKSFDTLRMAYDGKTFIRKLPTAQNSKFGFSLGNKTGFISFNRCYLADRLAQRENRSKSFLPDG